MQQEFVKCKAEYNVYVKNSKDSNLVHICLYVDDLIVTDSNLAEIKAFKGHMMKKFNMTDLGKLTYFLGMEFTKTSEDLVKHQKKYASDILKRFNMLNCNPASTLFKQIVGSYIAHCSN